MPKPVRKMQKANAAAHAAVLPKIPPELLDQLVKGPMTAEAVQDASTAFKKALIERALGAEMSHHLGYPAGADKPATATNQRNGKSGKTVFMDDGPVRIDVPVQLLMMQRGFLRVKHSSFFTNLSQCVPR